MRSRKAALNSLRGRYSTTISECESAIKIFEQQLGPNHPLTATTIATLGWEYARADKKSDARKQFDRALEILAANRNEISLSPVEGHIMAGLAQLYARREWNNALNDLREAVRIEAEVFEPVLGAAEDATFVETPSTADYLFNQAGLYANVGGSANNEKAFDLFEQVIAIRDKLLPPTHPDIPLTYDAFAALLKTMDKTEQADAMEKKAEQARALAKQND